jgi:hypothetical protein
MEEAGQQGRDLVTAGSTDGERAVAPPNLTEQPISPKDETAVSTNPYPDATIVTRTSSRILPADSTAPLTTPPLPLNAYSPDQNYYIGASGYDNATGQWGDYSNYVNSTNLQIVPPQAMYTDSSSVPFHSGYSFDSQMAAFGQFSPLASPLSPFLLDGQLYSPQQFQVSPYFTQQPVSPHLNSSHSISQADLTNSGQESINDNLLGGGYYLHYGSFDGGNSGAANSGVSYYNYQGDFGAADHYSNRSNSSDMGSYFAPLNSGYPHQPVGILGSYENTIRQQQTALHGFGMISNSSNRRYPHNSASYRNSGSLNSNWENSSRSSNHFLTDNKGGKLERERDSHLNPSMDSLGGGSNDRNRGPRASKPKLKVTTSSEEVISDTDGGGSTSAVILDLFNRPDFTTEYDNARFFVIKSFSEDNVHKSIKYNVWASTALGNRKLDAAYHEAKETKIECPIFLFFSVNASGQFCGVAEMIGSVDFENDANYWQQDRWSGQFPVKWHIIKDVPNSRFRHILLENNDNKPVTHSRDSQEVKLEEGIEMLKIFKEHEADTSIIDDFDYYDEREKVLNEKKARQQQQLTAATKISPINQLSENLAETLRLEGTSTSSSIISVSNNVKEVQKTE